ncbi:MAG: hypothetical protein ACI4S9_00680 [Christensenellales bacterium]
MKRINKIAVLLVITALLLSFSFGAAGAAFADGAEASISESYYRGVFDGEQNSEFTGKTAHIFFCELADKANLPDEFGVYVAAEGKKAYYKADSATDGKYGIAIYEFPEGSFEVGAYAKRDGTVTFSETSIPLDVDIVTVKYMMAWGNDYLITEKQLYSGETAEDVSYSQMKAARPDFPETLYAALAYYWHTANVEYPVWNQPGHLGDIYDFDTPVTSDLNLYTYMAQSRFSWNFPEDATYDPSNPFGTETQGQGLDGSLSFGEDYMSFVVNENASMGHVSQLQFCQTSLTLDATMKNLNIMYRNFGPDTVIRAFIYGTTPSDNSLQLLQAGNYGGLTANMTETDEVQKFSLPITAGTGNTIVWVRLEFLSSAADAYDINGTNIRIYSAAFGG